MTGKRKRIFLALLMAVSILMQQGDMLVLAEEDSVLQESTEPCLAQGDGPSEEQNKERETALEIEESGTKHQTEDAKEDNVEEVSQKLTEGENSGKQDDEKQMSQEQEA